MPKPIEITPEQAAALGAGRKSDYCARVRDFLAARPATHVAATLPLSWFEERVDRAASFGINIEAEVATFLELVLRAGDAIVAHPDIAAILSERDRTQHERVTLAEDHARLIVNSHTSRH